MNPKEVLVSNIDKLHTTKMGMDRIKRNLELDTNDVVSYCKNKILEEKCNVYCQGKNFYCEIDGIVITIHQHSYTMITAHIKNK